MITFAPHIIYDTQEVVPGGRTTMFFQNPHGRSQHFTNVPTPGTLERPFVITGLALIGDGIPREEMQNVLVRLCIGEVQQWAWHMSSLKVTRDSPLHRLEWDATRDYLGQKLDPAGILFAVQSMWDNMDDANARVGLMVMEWPWTLPMKMNFCLQLEAAPGFKGRSTMRAEIHGLIAREWA